ncbi:hypothetical protein KKH43_06415 [Patescibacteria group bacterium]|nr:hypothetical protein [Patescibacteria group bacterium]
MSNPKKGGSKAFLVVVIGLLISPFVFPRESQKAWNVIKENASKSLSMWKQELSGKKAKSQSRNIQRRYKSSYIPQNYVKQQYSGNYRDRFLRCRRVPFHVTFYYPAVQTQLHAKSYKRKRKWKQEKTQSIVVKRLNETKFPITVPWKYSINGSFKLHAKHGGFWVSHHRGNVFKEYVPRPSCIAKGAGDRVRKFRNPDRNCIKPLYHVAADQKRCFRYGTQMYIPAFDGLHVNGGSHNGIFAVGDIGSGVKGCNRIDVFLGDVHQKNYIYRLLKSRGVKEFKQRNGIYRLYLYGYVCK